MRRGGELRGRDVVQNGFRSLYRRWCRFYRGNLPDCGEWVYNTTNSSWETVGQDACGPNPKWSALTSPPITVPAPGSARLTFTHRYSFEPDATVWDGGQVRGELNGGAYETVPNSSFLPGAVTTVSWRAMASCKARWRSVATLTTTRTATLPASLSWELQRRRPDLGAIPGGLDDCSRGQLPNWEVTDLMVGLTAGGGR